ncbi:TonB family protein [Rhodohalobacter sp.]|uniref:TonB family protein n=1 Tax=Rhodohalobacter sp. TaxID=1974210 RepID=UPI002ACDB366|nr:TonB family protein [Rhodohalobacter sp.]MDZ7756900.1 TonB family protein [Rhodohalobacter sp.]
MDILILQIAELAESIFDAIWLPVVIWTVFTALIWTALRLMKNIHPVYQYHTRMALIFSLPAGLLALVAINNLADWISTSTSEATLKVLTLTSPVDVTFIPEESTGLPLISVIQTILFTVFILGMVYFISRIFMHSYNLVKLRSSCSFKPIKELDHLSSNNFGLALATGKDVQITFLDSDIIPVTFGFRNPVILLPVSLKSQPHKMNLAIRHELTHISQHDFFSHLMVILTEAVFWFHPLVHRLKRELIDYREMRCDNMVLSESSISRKEYASLLLELIPMPNLNKELSVNMAQESSNLKKRITMITQQTKTQQIPKWSSLLLLGIVFLTTAFAMACTDMQTQTVFDEEELDLMTNIDKTGEQGYHEIIIYMSEEEQANRHESKLEQLRMLEPEHIEAIQIWKGDQAVEKFGSRGEKGVIQVRTKLDAESYNNTLRALGMNPVNPESLTPEDGVEAQQDDFFVVVEKMPELIGGLGSIQQKMRYPEMARKAGIEGRVYVQFVVDENGNVVDPQILRGIGGGADEEAIRVVSQAKFKPGMQRGKPVRVKYSLPILFSLGNDESVDSESGQTSSAEVEAPATMGKRMIMEVRNEDGQLRGRVLDGETRQPLSGVNVILTGSNVGASTDSNGNFSIEADGSGEYELIFSYVGYEKASFSITR